MWTLNGEILQPSTHVAIGTSAKGSKLTISNASVENTGVYKLVAENEVGTAEAEVNLQVKGQLPCASAGLCVFCSNH